MMTAPSPATVSTCPRAAGRSITKSPPAWLTRQSAVSLGPAALWTRSPVWVVVATGRSGTGTGEVGTLGTGTGVGLPTPRKSRLAPERRERPRAVARIRDGPGPGPPARGR